MIKVINHPNGSIVIRELFPGGERAYRLWPDGAWDYSPGHENIWICVAAEDVPVRFLTVVVAA